MKTKAVISIAGVILALSCCAPNAIAGYMKEGVHKVDKTARGAVHASERGTKHVVRSASHGVHKVTHGTHRLVKKVL